MAVERIFTKNDAIAMMHRERAYSFRQVIAFVKKHGIDIGELLELMEEIANEAERPLAWEDLKPQNEKNNGK